MSEHEEVIAAVKKAVSDLGSAVVSLPDQKLEEPCSVLFRWDLDTTCETIVAIKGGLLITAGGSQYCPSDVVDYWDLIYILENTTTAEGA